MQLGIVRSFAVTLELKSREGLMDQVVVSESRKPALWSGIPCT